MVICKSRDVRNELQPEKVAQDKNTFFAMNYFEPRDFGRAKKLANFRWELEIETWEENLRWKLEVNNFADEERKCENVNALNGKHQLKSNWLIYPLK